MSANGKPGWETLISKMPDGTYNSTQVGTFRLASMRLGGSPAYEVLTDMGFRGRTVEQLVSYLERIECEEGLFLVKPQGERKGSKRVYEKSLMPFSRRSDVDLGLLGV